MVFRHSTPVQKLTILLQLLLLTTLGFPAQLAPPALAAPARVLSHSEQLTVLTAQADLIVRGHVTSVTSNWSANHRWIESAATVAVHYALAGSAPATLI